MKKSRILLMATACLLLQGCHPEHTGSSLFKTGDMCAKKFEDKKIKTHSALASCKARELRDDYAHSPKKEKAAIEGFIFAYSKIAKRLDNKEITIGEASNALHNAENEASISIQKNRGTYKEFGDDPQAMVGLCMAGGKNLNDCMEQQQNPVAYQQRKLQEKQIEELREINSRLFMMSSQPR